MKQSNTIKKEKNKIYRGIIISYLVIALFAPLLANDKPLYISIHGETFFPAISSNPYIFLPDSSGNNKKILKLNVDWKNIEVDNIFYPLVCWSSARSDLLNTYSSPFAKQKYFDGEKITELPFRFRHFLGTGKTGNDLLAGLIHGTRTSVAIGFFSMAIAIFLGIFLGGIAGYVGDDKLKINRRQLIAFLLLIIPAWFYAFHLRLSLLKESFADSMLNGVFQLILSLAIFIFIISLPLLHKNKKYAYTSKKIFIPVDSFISRFIEIFLSLPRLILILSIAAISRPSVLTIILIIGFTSWTEIARIMRAQVLQLRELNYISAAKAFGTSTMKIIIHHLLPNASSQILIIGTIGIASAILTETGLSFLGIGVPAGTATWGSLMFDAKENYQAWWLVIFTGLTIFLLLSSLYKQSTHLKYNEKKSTFS